MSAADERTLREALQALQDKGITIRVPASMVIDIFEYEGRWFVLYAEESPDSLPMYRLFTLRQQLITVSSRGRITTHDTGTKIDRRSVEELAPIAAERKQRILDCSIYGKQHTDAKYRDQTEAERLVIDSFQSVSFGYRAGAAAFLAHLRKQEGKITEHQARYLIKVARLFRRQLPQELCLIFFRSKEAAP